MATVQWYVDTDVDGGEADGTSWEDAYSSLNAFEAAEEVDLVTATDDYVVNCQASGETADTTVVDFNGWDTSGDYDITILGEGSGSGTNLDTSKYRIATAGQGDVGVINFGESFITLGDFQIDANPTTHGHCIKAEDDIAGTYYIYNCVFKLTTTGDYYNRGLTTNNNTKTFKIKNTLFYLVGGDAGYDLFCSKSIRVKAGGSALIPSGIMIDPKENIWFH